MNLGNGSGELIKEREHKRKPGKNQEEMTVNGGEEYRGFFKMMISLR